ncbi:DUF6708 domain-containing protein [Achromobacter sp. UBA2119]|uniref:DUF6708 domain-containing protein n=1 Tax=Achromobacter sp. UBA2119 TaxID=1945911 RepID=UPI00257D4853|nr:DUF6708 domain-containing protein [Achromobacter sp. UBA2119]
MDLVGVWQWSIPMKFDRPSHEVPAVEKSWVYSRVDALRIGDPPLGVAPAVDNNLIRMTEDCLFMRTASGSLYGGRYSMTWWATVVGVFAWFFFSVTLLASYKYSADSKEIADGYGSYYGEFWFYPIGMAAALWVSCFWMYIPWRRQLPIIFNRRTRKVSCFVDSRVISEDWDSINAYIKDVTTIAVGGAPVNEGILSLVFQRWGNDGKQLRVVIYGTRDAPAAMVNRGIYGAAMVWEYIRLYMREGADAVPPTTSVAEYRLSRPLDAFRHFNPLKMLRVKIWWYPVAVPFFLFVALPLAPVAIVGDLLYYALDRILPRRRWPQELVHACDNVWDGRDD